MLTIWDSTTHFVSDVTCFMGLAYTWRPAARREPILQDFVWGTHFMGLALHPGAVRPREAPIL